MTLDSTTVALEDAESKIEVNATKIPLEVQAVSVRHRSAEMIVSEQRSGSESADRIYLRCRQRA
jgi:hypothetical protein